MSVAIAVIDSNRAYLASDRQATDQFTLQADHEKVMKQTVFGNQLMPVAMQAGIEEYLRQFIERVANRSLFVSREYVFWECGAQE